MKVTEFISEVSWTDVPVEVRRRMAWLLRDFVAVSIAGSSTPIAQIALDYARVEHSGDLATSLVDGRRLAVTGAAWANGVLANSLDFDDGHRLVKGHPGANVVPAALAVAQACDATVEELLAAIVVGYEVAVRAGLQLHANSRDYHGSGAWGAVGAAAAAARLLRLDTAQIGHALGLAGYHAPRAPVMQSVAEPAMTKDACGWGALVGVSSALLAQRSFTATRTDHFNRGAWVDLFARWHVLDVYIKPFPCCRWSHPAIEAALALRLSSDLVPERIACVRVRTFGAATRLARHQPTTTEEAQYSLVWPLAIALAHRDFTVASIHPASFTDPTARLLASLVKAEIDPYFDREFPARRFAQVTVETNDGASYRSGTTEAPGEPDDPKWQEIIARKFEAFDGKDIERPVRVSLSHAGKDELLWVLSNSAADATELARPV